MRPTQVTACHAQHVYEHNLGTSESADRESRFWDIPLRGPVITLLRVGLVRTCLQKNMMESWKNHVLHENGNRIVHYLTKGVSAFFFIGLSVTFTHALHRMLLALLYLSQPFTLYLR